MLKVPLATRVQLELALFLSRGWAFYTCCQAIKHLSDTGISAPRASRHYHMSEQPMWKHDRSVRKQNGLYPAFSYVILSFLGLISSCLVSREPKCAFRNNFLERFSCGQQKKQIKKTSPECSAITCIVSLRVSDETPPGCFLDLFVFNQEMQTILF